MELTSGLSRACVVLVKSLLVRCLLVALTASPAASAFVATPVGGRPGELDLYLQLLTERGKTEPNENTASFMKPTEWFEGTLGAGYTWGHFGPLQFFSTRLELTYFSTPAERNDPDEWFVGAEGSSPAGTLSPECTNGATYLGGGRCEFYAADQGSIVTGSVSFALVHDPKFALGLFLKAQVPLAMDREKFGNPRYDAFGLGSQGGVQLTDWLRYESAIYVGTGSRPFGTEQNGALALNNVFHFHAERWLLPWKAGVKVGPYVEGDINERYDRRYDRAYSPVRTAPGGGLQQQKDRIRAVRFATVLLPYFLVTEHLSVELGYIQKFFGYDARATQVYFVGFRGLVDLGS